MGPSFTQGVFLDKTSAPSFTAFVIGLATLWWKLHLKSHIGETAVSGGMLQNPKP